MPRPTTHERFWARVERNGPNGCWLWTGATDGNVPPYGSFWTGHCHTGAHRFAYEALVGPIPDGLVIDHLCRVRHCVNPAHMAPVTTGENVLRGESPSAKQARKTHCPNGHEYDYRWGSKRYCLTCRAEYVRPERRKVAV